MKYSKTLFVIIPLVFILSALAGLAYRKYIKAPRTARRVLPTATPMPKTTPTSIPRASLKWGVFAGGGVNEFISLRQTIPVKADFLPAFVHWGNENKFPQTLAAHATLQDQTLVIYWEAMDYNHPNKEEDQRFSYDRILAGDWDAYLSSFAASAKNYGRPVILIPFEEMNGEWYPWSITKNGNSGQKHIDAFRYVRKFFSDAPNVSFAWVINSDNVPDFIQNDPMTYYPGDDYVDYVGVNGFNFGEPWQSFTEIFSQPLSDLETLQKPIMIFSMASAEGPAKDDWIKEVAQQLPKHPKVIGWIWFNENKEKDWRIWSDADSQAAFVEYLIPDGS